VGLRRQFFIGIIALSLAVLLSYGSQANSSQINFSKGLNLSHWFFVRVEADEKMETSAYLQKWMTESEVRPIAEAGFTHVRLSIDPDFLQPNGAKGNFKIPIDRLEAIDRAIFLIESENLGVILDLHPLRPLKLESPPYGADYRNLENIWKILSDRYRNHSQRIAYEILNEPQVKDPKLWNDITTKLVAAIRRIDSSHTILVSAHGYSGVGELMDFRPVAGDRILHTFHFYLPMTFTHQGAGWLEEYASLKDIPYPLEVIPPEGVPPNGRSQTTPEAQKLWKEYRDSKFARIQLEAEIKKVTQWRDRYGVDIYCGEYGVHGVAPSGDRSRWYRDVSEILEREKMGHAVWSYRGTFGIAPESAPGDQAPMGTQFLRAIGL
jgi:endoglucanase